MFDQDRLIEDCRTAVAAGQGSRAVREIVARAVADPAAVLRDLGTPETGGLVPLYRSPTLTVLNVMWHPRQVIMPHNHAMWAVIGVYAGREDNILWRRLPEDAKGQIEAGGAKTLGARDTVVLGPEAIHSVVNPLGRVTGAIHIYGGDFFAAERSEWDPESLTEMPYDMAKAMAMFAAQQAAQGAPR